MDSDSLEAIDLRGGQLAESSTTNLLTALKDSKSIKSLKHLPQLDKEVYTAKRVVAVLP